MYSGGLLLVRIEPSRIAGIYTLSTSYNNDIEYPAWILNMLYTPHLLCIIMLHRTATCKVRMDLWNSTSAEGDTLMTK
ncbi:hypothetical protein BDW69DRAFT_91061 [Aspergillus filifer]